MDNYEKEIPEKENKCVKCINKTDFNKCSTCVHRYWKPRKSTIRGQFNTNTENNPKEFMKAIKKSKLYGMKFTD